MAQNYLAALLMFAAVHCAVANLCSPDLDTGDALRINAECGEESSGLQVHWEMNSSNDIVYFAQIEYLCRGLSASDEQQEREILVNISVNDPNSLLGQENITIPEGETTNCTIYACYLDDQFDLIGTQPVTATCGVTPTPRPDTEPTTASSDEIALRINTECGEGDSGLQVSWEGDSSSVILILYIEYSCRRLSASDEHQERETLVNNPSSLFGQESIAIPEGETTECTIYASYLDDEFDLISIQPVTATCGVTQALDTEPTTDVASITVPSPPPSDTDADQRRSASAVVRGIALSINEEEQELPSSSKVTSVTGTFVISAVSIAVALVTCLGI